MYVDDYALEKRGGLETSKTIKSNASACGSFTFGVPCGFRVSGFGFRVWGVEIGVEGSGRSV